MAENKNIQEGLYNTPAVQPPTIEELTEISKTYGLGCTNSEMLAYQGHINNVLASYERLSKLVEPQLPFRHPRGPGQRPTSQDNPYNAWSWRCDIQGAATGKLEGKTVAIKDNTAVAGVPMQNGSRVLEGYVPEFDATVVTRILDAGGRILGKAACEDLCDSGSSFTTASGPVHNPADVTRTTGGSSSGCGALVAGGIVDMAVGGDQGGSVRIPGSWCGIVALKPTYGLVPYTGAMGIELTLDHLGPMTRTVTDCALLLEVMAGYDDGRDPRQQIHIKVPEYTKTMKQDIAGLKIGVVQEGFRNTEPDVDRIVRDAATSLLKSGTVVEDVSVPLHDEGVYIWNPVYLQGAHKFMIEGNGNGCFWKGHYPISMQEAFARGRQLRPYDFSPTVKSTILFGEYIGNKYQTKFYAKAQNMTRVLTAAYDEALKTYDVLAMPTIPFKATKLPSADLPLSDKFVRAFGMVRNVCPFNSTGHPALTINAGKGDGGLPVGIMFVGRHFDESTVLRVAYAFEQIRDGLQ